MAYRCRECGEEDHPGTPCRPPEDPPVEDLDPAAAVDEVTNLLQFPGAGDEAAPTPDDAQPAPRRYRDIPIEDRPELLVAEALGFAGNAQACLIQAEQYANKPLADPNEKLAAVQLALLQGQLQAQIAQARATIALTAAIEKQTALTASIYKNTGIGNG